MILRRRHAEERHVSEEGHMRMKAIINSNPRNAWRHQKVEISTLMRAHTHTPIQYTFSYIHKIMYTYAFTNPHTHKIYVHTYVYTQLIEF